MPNIFKNLFLAVRVAIVASLCAASAYGGIQYGQDKAEQHAQRAALAFNCGEIDTKTLAFKYRLAPELAANAKMLPASSLR